MNFYFGLRDWPAADMSDPLVIKKGHLKPARVKSVVVRNTCTVVSQPENKKEFFEIELKIILSGPRQAIPNFWAGYCKLATDHDHHHLS